MPSEQRPSSESRPSPEQRPPGEDLSPPRRGTSRPGPAGGDDAVADDGRPVGDRVELTPPAEIARAALNRAKAAAVGRGIRPGQAPRRRSPLEPLRGSPGKDGRDPRLVADTLAALVRDRGWTQDVSVGGVIGRWRDVVGDEIADHCTPETFDDGVLQVRTDSTSWATNLRLLVPNLLRRLADDVGEGVVREVKVAGPVGPGFKRGPRSVPGRGPRDTYG